MDFGGFVFPIKECHIKLLSWIFQQVIFDEPYFWEKTQPRSICPFVQPLRECRPDGKPLTHDNCKVGMRVKTLREFTSGDGKTVISAGSCGTVKEHIREGRKYKNEGTVYLTVKWEEDRRDIVWDHYDLGGLIVSEH